MSKTLIVTKYPDDTRALQVDLTSDLAPGEQILSVTLGGVSPSGLEVNLVNYSTPVFNLQIGSGQDNTSYGFLVNVSTDAPRVFTKQVAVVCNASLAYQFKVVNPDAFNTLIGSIQAGDAGIGVAVFNFPPSFDPTGGYVKWEFIDQNGTTYASGNAFSYEIYNTGASNKVEAQAVINCPSEVPTTLIGQKYQIRWTLLIPDQQPIYSYESISVNSLSSVPIGTEDAVELWGDNAQFSMVTEKAYDHVGFEIYFQNMLAIPYVECVDKTRTSDGWLYRGIIDPQIAGMPPFLDPYTIIWKYWDNNSVNAPQRDTARFFLVSASILSAVDDMRAMVQKANATIAGQQDILFTTPLLLAYLRRGKDHFNGLYGMLTSFDMTNAQGPIREYWIRCSEIMALRSQFLAEGEKVFNYSGAAVQLDSDRTSYYQSLAQDIQATIDAEGKVFKQNLIKKGIISGDGNSNSVAPRQGSAGAAVITVSPASGFGKFASRFGNGNLR